MDARRLRFVDQTFRLVTFTCNGIDALDLAGRLQVLREVHRVLEPKGYFVFSALNRKGSAYGARWPDLAVFEGSWRSPLVFGRTLARFVIGGRNWFRSRVLTHDSSVLAIGSMAADNFGLLGLFTSVSEQIRELHDCGFAVDAIFDPDGFGVALDRCDASAAPWHYFIARRLDEATPAST